MLILNARLINFPIDCFFVSCLLYLFQKVSVSASFSFGDDDCGEDEEETEEEEEAVDNDEAVARDFAVFWYFSLIMAYLLYPEPGEKDIVLDWFRSFFTSLGMT